MMTETLGNFPFCPILLWFERIETEPNVVIGCSSGIGEGPLLYLPIGFILIRPRRSHLSPSYRWLNEQFDRRRKQTNYGIIEDLV